MALKTQTPTVKFLSTHCPWLWKRKPEQYSFSQRIAHGPENTNLYSTVLVNVLPMEISFHPWQNLKKQTFVNQEPANISDYWTEACKILLLLLKF